MAVPEAYLWLIKLPERSTPAPGDYEGDGQTDIAIQRLESTTAWWILPSSTGSRYVMSSFGEFPVPLGYLSPRVWF